PSSGWRNCPRSARKLDHGPPVAQDGAGRDGDRPTTVRLCPSGDPVSGYHERAGAVSWTLDLWPPSGDSVCRSIRWLTSRGAVDPLPTRTGRNINRSEEHTSEL